MREIDQLLAIIDAAYDRKSWHGTNLRGAITRIEPAQVTWRPGAERHNVWELVVHAAYWKYAVRRRLTGEKRGSFALEGSNWFGQSGEGGERAWRRDVALLVAEHRRLREVVAALRDSDLPRAVAGSTHTTARLVYGVAAHDVYHAGQIQVVKRLAGGGGVD